MNDYLGETTTQNITMPRGDSRAYTVTLKDEAGVQIPFTAGDSVFFTAKLDLSVEVPDVLIEVTTFTDDSAVIHFVPSDTDSLDPGVYAYDIQWNTGTDKYTIIKGFLNIEEDVTRD